MPSRHFLSNDESPAMTIPVLPLEGLIRLDTVLAHYQISKAQLYQEIAEGTFPGQIKIGRSSFWDARTFRAFLKEHGAAVLVAVEDVEGQPQNL